MPDGIAPPPVALPVEPPDDPVETEPLVSSADAVEPGAMPEAVEEETGWLIPAIVFAGFNLLLLIVGLVWFLIRRRATQSADIGLQDLIDEVDAGRDAHGQVQEHAA